MAFTAVDVWIAALIFARVGAMMSLMPGLGEPAVPGQARLSLALLLTFLLHPVLKGLVPAEPPAMGAAMALVISEVAVGLMIGMIARMLASALVIAGQILGMETGLAFSQVADPTMTQAGQAIGVFLSLLGATLIFSAGLHLDLIAAMVRSYEAFAPGAPLPLSDAAGWAVSATGEAMLIGVRIAAPVLLAGIVFRAGLGVMARLIPQIQVFFIAMPLNILGGFVLIALTLSTGMLIWLDRFDQFAADLR
jgi:flagellar biosynthetic protein FliR